MVNPSNGWIHPPLFADEGVIEAVDTQYALSLYTFDVAPEDDKFYAALETNPQEVKADDQKAWALDEEIEPVETHRGFWLNGDANLDDPSPADVFVALGYGEIYCPIGQHASGNPAEGDHLISREDYLRISSGLYTPETYINTPLLEGYDPYKMLVNH